jgi:uncharacterized protein YkvS
MFKNSIKLSLSVILGLGVMFSGCGEDTSEADAYNIEQWLDSGDNQKVLDYLGDCSSYSGEAKTDCYLNVGAAYFGMAKFDMISLSKEFANIEEKFPDDNQDENRSKEFNKVVFAKLDEPALKKGIEYYSKVVDGNDSVCNEKEYDNLEEKQKQACLSINPVLLSNIVNDDDTNDDNKSENAASLGDIIEFKDALQDAVPELKSEELVAIIDGDTLDNTQDINRNDTLDSVEATDYALKVFAFSKVWDGNDTVYSEFNRSVTYTNNALKDKNITLAKIDVNSTITNDQNIFFRLIEFGNDYNTTLTTIPDTICDANNTIITGVSENNITLTSGNSYLPCVKLKEDGNATSFNDSVVNVLNNDDLLASIALASDSEDDTKTDDDKIAEFKNDICGITGDANSSNQGLCIVDSNGTITITQEAVIDYMNKDK